MPRPEVINDPAVARQTAYFVAPVLPPPPVAKPWRKIGLVIFFVLLTIVFLILALTVRSFWWYIPMTVTAVTAGLITVTVFV